MPYFSVKIKERKKGKKTPKTYLIFLPNIKNVSLLFFLAVNISPYIMFCRLALLCAHLLTKSRHGKIGYKLISQRKSDGPNCYVSCLYSVNDSYMDLEW